MQLALYRAERPEIFDEIIGQKHIVRILQNQIKTGTVSQAYLFTGTHGTGKTTTARILAKAVNCLDNENADETTVLPCGHCDNCEAIRQGKFVDVIELDAASNNGVDDLRSIIDLVKYPPTVGRYKVYIIDEVHMLSPAAENAFLKTLEEPPEYAIFILATTDPQKVRATIRSRCMQLNFKRVSEDELIEGMDKICRKKGIAATRDALGTIASKADGSVRDAFSILEQCMAAGDSSLDRKLVLEYTGSAGDEFYLALTDAVSRGDIGKALLYIDEIVRRGKDSKQLLKEWLEHYRNLMVIRYVARAERVVNSSAENIARLKAQADSIDIGSIDRAIRLISEYVNIGRYSDRPRILLETAAVRLASGDVSGGLQSEVGQKASVRPSQARAMNGDADRRIKAGTAPENRTETVKHEIQEAAVEQEPEEPITQFTAGPREIAGDPEDMWDRIVEEMTRHDTSFGAIVGRNSMGYSFEGDELVVVVKQNKLALAENKLDEIAKAAKMIYGQNTLIQLKGGNLEKVKKSQNPEEEDPGAEILDTDALMKELQEDASSLFGVNVEVIDN